MKTCNRCGKTLVTDYIHTCSPNAAYYRALAGQLAEALRTLVAQEHGMPSGSSVDCDCWECASFNLMTAALDAAARENL